MNTKPRLLDLMAERATAGLTAESLLELEGLIDAHPEWDNDSFELAAAAVELALLGPSPPLSRGLRAHLASLALYGSEPGDPEPGPPALEPGLAGPRAELIAHAPDLVHPLWHPTDDVAAAAVSGDVAWSTSLHSGYALIRGLEANDPAETQYQLWIVDADRDPTYPVDAGVFDVTTTETIVALNPKLEIMQPTSFLLTIERRGGVVVSEQDRLVLRTDPREI